MIPNENDRKLSTGDVAASGNFGISFKDEVHLMGILRDTLYSDKVLAVLREYSANAWDSHRSSGIGDQPIQITLPTRSAPTLIIRDFGSGLSPDDVFKVYTQYGASTKRGSDDTVGMLGIGSKSAFAYSDSFTITSWHGGQKRVYIAVLDESNRGKCDLVHTEDCGTETGVEIQIAVRRDDIDEFDHKARRLFKHFSPRPLINTDLAPLPEDQTVLSNGSIVPAGRGEGGEWVAVMGCVPYRINLDQLPADRLNKALHNLNGTVNFGIGGVQISASREELKYSTVTKEALLAKFDALIDEYVEKALELVNTDLITEWDKRLRILVLDDLNLTVPEQWESFTKIHVKIFDPGISAPLFSIIHNRSAVSTITVTPDLRLLIDDTGKNLKWYNLSADDYVVRTTFKKNGDLRTLLDAALLAAKLTGVKIEKLSDLPWTPSSRSVTRGKANPKAKVRTFVFTGGQRQYKSPYSEHWDMTDRTPQATDVFVIIESYKAADGHDFYRDYTNDSKIARLFGVSMPQIYGYKTSDKKPVTKNDCIGTEYRVWRQNFATNLVTLPEHQELIAAYRFKQAVNGSSGYGSYAPTVKMFRKVVADLGTDHEISLLSAEWMTAFKTLEGKDDHLIGNTLRQAGLSADDPGTKRRIDAIKERYPLLRHGDGLRAVWYTNGYNDDDSTTTREWREYVMMVDKVHSVDTISSATAIPKKVQSSDDTSNSVHAH